MSRKKKIKEPDFSSDEELNSLKNRYFKLYPKETYGRTKEITKKLNELEKLIRDRQQKLTDEYNL